MKERLVGRQTTASLEEPISRLALRGPILIFIAASAIALSAFTSRADAAVTVTLAGVGAGTVTSDTGAPTINCSLSGGLTSGTCSNEPPVDFSGVPTFLSVDPAPGSVFAGWTVGEGTCAAALTPCELPFTSFGSGYSLTASFELPPTPDPPIAATDPVGAGTRAYLAMLNGRVNPNGSGVTDCHFEYGRTSAYGKMTRCDQSPVALGTGAMDEPVSATTEPLDPNTTYHFRLFASNIGGTAKGKDRTFTTDAASFDGCANAQIRAAQGIAALQLPACMALEMVSPPNKSQQYARFPSLSVNGNRVLFDSIAALGETPGRLSGSSDAYVATRTASGWVTASTTPPPPVFGGSVAAAGFTPDFSRWFHLGGSDEQVALGSTQAFDAGLGRIFSPISPLMTPLAGGSGAAFGNFPAFQGASADHSRFYFKAQDGRPVDAPGAKSFGYLPDDPQPNGTGEDSNLYVAGSGASGQPSVALVARDRDGKVWGANCGARLGGIQSTLGVDLSLRNGMRNQGAIAADGSAVYFSTRPSQSIGADCTEANKMRILRRTQTETGPEIHELFQSECTRVSPPCSGIDGDDVFQGGSIDQTKVYFTTTRQLTDTDLDGGGGSCDSTSSVPGCDLYLYDSTMPSGERLTQVSAGESTALTPGMGADVRNSITAISADGSHAYFVASSVLTTEPNSEGAVAQASESNLYVYQRNESHPTGDIAFIGVLDASDGNLFGSEAGTWGNLAAFPVPIMGHDVQGREVGGDGHVILFISRAPLTPDDTDTARDLFRYSADSTMLERISKAGPHGSDNGAFDVTTSDKGGGLGTEYAAKGRWVSEDGETIVFTTSEALLSGDVNGVEDSYMWRDGELFRLLGSAQINQLSSAVTNDPTLSPDGSTVAFTSSEQLLPGDGDTVEDIYVARANGGFATLLPPGCEGEACQGAPGPSPGATDAVTSSFTGQGNFSEGGSKPRCPKGKTRRHGRCFKKKHQGRKHGKGLQGRSGTSGRGGSR
jgi:hypothetical protein